MPITAQKGPYNIIKSIFVKIMDFVKKIINFGHQKK
jgi:hypothetical protein